MSAEITGWMMETLVWTAVLIAFVLMVRRPIARAFGPQIAYALWALPALRLLLPPLELPAWMRLMPAAPTAQGPEQVPAEAPTLIEESAMTAIEAPTALVESGNGAPRDAVVGAATDSTQTPTHTPGFDISGFDTGLLMELGVAAWLIGAAIFMVLRFSAYFRLRDELLAEGREMGRSGSVRLIETPGTKAPLAFGVIDKVVALPEGFLAHPDRRSRDLALAHELAHHKGGDLLANVLVQPLFAIHWWNPLGRYGWLALRRDQEAACDARVMASAEADEREVYANLIVSFAAGPNVALAAPMACPVLGEKSIIHRLRSLKMDNTNTKRRVAGKLMLGAAVVALPMTASISYAASEGPDVPELAIASPSIPSALVAPVAPSAPDAPTAPLVDDQIIVIDPDGEVSVDGTEGKNVFVWKSEEGEGEPRVIVRSENSSVRFFDGTEFDGSKSLSKEDLERLLERSESSKLVLKSRGDTIRFFDRSDLGTEGRLSEEQIEEILAEVRESLEEANEELKRLPEIIEEAQAEAREARRVEARRVEARQMIRVERGCKGGEEIVTETKGDDGVTVLHICQKSVMAQALNGLREARRSLEGTDMDSGARSRALSEIDKQISELEREAR